MKKEYLNEISNSDDELNEDDWNEIFEDKSKEKQNDNNQKKYNGSKTAKDGFKEEEYICNELSTNIKLREGFEKHFNIKLNNNAILISCNKKTDIKIGNIQIQHKKTKKNQFGQVDRHYVNNLLEKVPKLKDIEKILKNLCELPVDEKTGYCDRKQEIKKLNKSNYSKDELNNLINIIEKNKKDIIEYAFCGYEEVYTPNYFSISLYNSKNKRIKIIFWKMNDIINYLLDKKFKTFIREPNNTVIEISNGLTFQRKGGDNGRKQANNFQIKFISSILPLDNAFVFNL